MRSVLRWSLPIVAGLLCSTGLASWAEEAAAPDISSRVILTTGLDADDLPVDTILEVPMDVGRFYGVVELSNLEEDRVYRYACRIYDSRGEVVRADQGTLTAEGETRRFWCLYRPDACVDQPGLWRFEGYLDDERLVETEFPVVPASERDESAAAGNR